MATSIQKSRNLSPLEKATFHQVTGAGKSRIKREFFGLSPTDIAAIEQECDVRLAVHLNSDTGARSA